jgi:hypothetical protein
MVFTITLSEILAQLLETIALFLYGFMPGFFIFMSLIIPFLLVFKIFRRGAKLAEKAYPR